jgi:MoaA/NifB/PqqE/SkfB family radical SAM enzyme
MNPWRLPWGVHRANQSVIDNVEWPMKSVPVMSMNERHNTPIRRLALWWDLQRMPMLDWIQVEITSRCNASCLYCPRTAYSNRWADRDLSPDLFHALLPFFATTRLVHLQGWGEPLLHRDFFDMVGLARKAGCRVGTTTNGTLLTRENITRLVASGIDHVAFSLAGIGANNDGIRRGTEFGAIVQAISEIAAVKKKLQSDTPAVNVSYLLLNSHVASLAEIVAALEGRGIENIIVSTLDFVPARDLESERITPKNETAYRELKSRLDGLVEEGKRAGLTVHYRLADPGKKNRTCTENIGRALVVSADGAVSPCVFTNIPASGVTHIEEGNEKNYERLTFGNLSENPLSSIWRNERYADFRKSFRGTLNPRCLQCPKLAGA